MASLSHVTVCTGSCGGVFILCSVALRRRRSVVLALGERTPSRHFIPCFSHRLLRFAPRGQKLLAVKNSGKADGCNRETKKQRIMSQFGIELLSLCGICMI